MQHRASTGPNMPDNWPLYTPYKAAVDCNIASPAPARGSSKVAHCCVVLNDAERHGKEGTYRSESPLLYLLSESPLRLS